MEYTEKMTIADRVATLLFSDVPRRVKLYGQMGSVKASSQAIIDIKVAFYDCQPWLTDKTKEQIMEAMETLPTQGAPQDVHSWLDKVYAPMLRDRGLKDFLYKHSQINDSTV